MYRFNFCLFCVVLCSLTVLGDDLNTQKPATITVPTKSSESTSVDVIPEKPKPTTPKPTTTPTTTSTTPTPTTPPPTTPPPTTPPPTTPPPTTSPKPNPPKPTPAPAPKPVPAPQQGKWNYTNTNNVTCILVQFAAQLNITYTNSSSALTYVLLNVPANATVVNGNCSDADQSLNLTWPASTEGNITTWNNMILFFRSNSTTKTYELKGINVTLAPQEFPNSEENQEVELWHGAEWQTPLATSYRCGTPTQLNMTTDLKNVAATITLSQLQEEAFRTAKNGVFSAARECGGGDVPDAVPIAVGCALGGLVVVVLVAYLVARRRSTARGYLSM